ncbi:MAG: glycosyltransferase family 2 protein [Solirubrobacteraceae bacterium]
MTQRLLVVSPLRNEAAHLELVARAIAAQTRPPDTWVLIDDGSTDETPAIIADLARRFEFVAVTRSSGGPERVRDRLAVAAEAIAFNAALATVPWRDYTHVSKLDGDIELPARYFELLLGSFAADPQLGLAGGVLLERSPTGWRLDPVPAQYHVRGALKCWSRECLDAIGGIEERLGWDTLDEVYARMHGYRTRSLPELVARHHRPLASADGILRGRSRYGRTYYALRFPPQWVAARALKTALDRPRLISGVAFMGGYILAAATGAERVQDAAYRRWMRRELAERTRAALRR